MNDLNNVETPCLILDKSKLYKNCLLLRERCKNLNITLRPHVKTPKSIEIARIALDKKSGPITVSTLNEAEYFASSGFSDILYAVGIAPNKFSRVSYLQKKYNCKIRIILDSVEIAKLLSDFSNLNDEKFEVLIEIDCGESRGGIDPDDRALKDISLIFNVNKNIEFLGVMTHAGHSYNSDNKSEIKKIANHERDTALKAVKNLNEINQLCKIVSVGSTPTVLYASHLNGITECRCGIYMLWDLSQVSRKICKFEDIAISVLATVINHNHQKNRIIVDAGALALSKDISANKFMPYVGFGVVCEINSTKPLDGISINEVHQEHGTINLPSKKWFKNFPLGSVIRILPNHSCITCAGHDKYYVVENNNIIDIWERKNGW